MCSVPLKVLFVQILLPGCQLTSRFVGRVQMSDDQLYPNDNSARKSDSPTTTTQTIKSYIYWVLKMFLVAKFFPIFLSFLNFESFRNIFEACPTQNCDRGSVDRISLDIFTWSNFLIKRLKISQLIETFINDSINCQKRTYRFWRLIKTF